jgi:endonuclease/exonuclease/phosphatase family metal-dependent hydrolase
VRLATFNVMSGRSLADGRVDADLFAAAVAALDVDVLALQEVDVGQPRSGRLDLAALAAQALGAGEYRFVATVAGTPGGDWCPAGPGAGEGPRYGVALLSRLPVRRWWVLRLPAAPVRSPVYVPGPDGRGGLLLLRDEPRAVVAAEVVGPGGPVTVAGTHLSFVPGWSGYQLATALRALRGLSGPRVLLGDLNLPGWLVRAVPGWRSLAGAATFPAHRPRVQLDHALGHGDLPPVTRVATPAVAVSDHRPLVVELGSR